MSKSESEMSEEEVVAVDEDVDGEEEQSPKKDKKEKTKRKAEVKEGKFKSHFTNRPKALKAFKSKKWETTELVSFKTKS